jgi:HEAT repeat protein
MLRLIPWMIVLLFAGCSQSPERATVNTANALLDEGHVQSALDMVENSLRQHPDSAPLLRMQVVLLLRQQQFDRAAVALQHVPAGEPIVVDILHHRDRIVRENGAKLISDQPNANDFREIVRAADDSDPVVRRYCARALGQLGDPDACKPLFRLLSDDNWFVRAEAASALGKIGDARAIGWIAQLLGDSDGYVRYSATRALYDLATQSSRSSLLRAFDLAQGPQRFAIAIALAKLHDPVALAPLADAAQSKDAETRRVAAEALGESGLLAGTNALEVLLKDPDLAVRAQAEAAISEIKNSGTR